MDFKQLEVFVGVVRLGSFSRAAEHLFLAQPTISAHIKALEEELGTELIVRAGRQVHPSENGRTLYKYAQEMLSLRECALAACSAKREVELHGTVSVAASTVPCQHVLPQITAAFRKQHPGVTFALSCCDSAGVVSDVLAGKAEIGLTGTVLKNPKLAFRDFMDDELVIIAPPSMPYPDSSDAEMRLRDLMKVPFIVREPGSGTRREMESYLQKLGVKPAQLHVVAQMDDPRAVQNAVAQGMGISVVSKLSCADYVQLGRLRMLRLEGEPIMRRLYLVCHMHRRLSPAAERFYHYAANDNNAVECAGVKPVACNHGPVGKKEK